MIKRIAVWVLFFSCVLGTAVPLTAQPGDEVPEDYRKLRELHIFADERNGQWAGSGNGMILETVGEGGQATLPIDENEIYNELPSYRVQVSEQDGWWAFILAGNDWESYSIAPYYPEGFLEFNVKGANGQEDFKVTLSDIEIGRNPENVSSAEIAVSTILDVTDEWQHVKIPLQAFLSSSANFNLN